jgi:glutathione S-transferase
VYTDDRIPVAANAADRVEFIKRKEAGEFPYGQVPVFTYNGTRIAQSGAIIRFIAKQYHLNGDNDVEQALIDGGYEAVLDIRKGYFTARGDAAKVATYWSETFPQQVSTLAKNIVGSASAPFFTGKRLSYVDVAIYYLFCT